MALVKGSRLGDRLVGTVTNDYIFAFRGNDTILAGGGDDRIFGGAGNERVYGGAGNDTIYGAAGADTLTGGAGNDYIIASELSSTGLGSDLGRIDRIFGGAGNDYMRIDRNDVALGGSGVDVLTFDGITTPETLWRIDFSGIGGVAAATFAQAGTYYGTTRVGQFESVNLSISNALAGSSMIGSAGNDFLGMHLNFGSPGGVGVRITGRAGNDGVYGTLGNDRLIGGTGNDSLGGSMGNDTLLGNSGDDELAGGNGADRLTGGAGCDQFIFAAQDVSAQGIPIIVDFSRADDILIFTLGGAEIDFGTELNLLQKATVVTNATTAAGIAQFLYDTDSGRLSLDINGLTAGGVFAVLTLQNMVSITASDIWFE